MFVWTICLESLILSFPKVAQIPSESPCISRNNIFCITHNTAYVLIKVPYFIYKTTHCSLLRLIVRSALDVATFATRRLHACHHARAPSGVRWNCGREISGKFSLNADFHVTFSDLLHAVKLRHGDHKLYFNSEGRSVEELFALKFLRFQSGLNPRTWVQKASTLPLDHRSRLSNSLKNTIIFKYCNILQNV
jgi:hypothetical protein